MRTLLFDAYDVVRGWRRDRGYASVVILTLALSIGATTAAFSIVDGVLLKPLAYADADRLVDVREVWHELIDRVPSLEVNERHFEHWRAHARTFESMAQYQLLPAHLTGSGEAMQISAVRASGSLFDVLRVDAALGRTLVPDDEREGRADVVVLGHQLWRQRFGGRPDIVGDYLTIDGRPHTVVGVLPEDFRLPGRAGFTTAIGAVLPLRIERGWIGEHNNRAIARLRPEATIEQARAELAVLQRQVGEIATAESGETVTLSATVTPLADVVVGRARRGLVLLLAAAAAVLLMTCSNLANLALSRAVSRAREGAIRAALGAGRARLVARAVLEQLLLGIVGAALGVGVASVALTLFVQTAPIDIPRLDEVRLDFRVLAFAAVGGIVAGLLVALLPARRAAASDVQTTLRTTGAAVGSGPGAERARQALLATQVAGAVALLVVTGLLGVSLLRVLDVDRGFDEESVIAVPLALPAARYADAPARVAAFDRLLASIEAVPAVTAASFASLLPMEGEGQVNFVVPEGATIPRNEQPTANFRFVAADFFQTLGIPLVRGRSIRNDDRRPDRLTAAVISAPVAERLWPGEDPIGKRFGRGIEGEPGFEVVGVAADVRYTSIERTPPLMVYVPYWWQSRASMSLLVRSAADPAALMPDLGRAIRSIDPEIAVGQMGSVAELVANATAARRYQVRLFIVFGLVALVIAIVGVYGVTAYGVSRRRREMNLRVALGAQPGRVRALIVWQSAAPLLAGVTLGAIAAAALGGVLASVLYEVNPRDPAITGAAVALVATSGLLTAALAARRGLRIDPMAALRDE